MAVSILTYNSAQQVSPFAKQIVAIYREAFGQAPYYKNESEVHAFERVFERHMQRVGFRCVLAQDEHTQSILGFAYGYTGEDGQWWHDLVVQEMPPADAAYWMTDVFEVVELAVYTNAQGHGYGGRLHDALLRDQPHHTALLSTYQAETNATHMYEKRGWITLISHFIFPGYAEPYQILGKRLHSR